MSLFLVNVEMLMVIGEAGNCYDKLVMNVVRTVMMCGVGKKLGKREII